MGAKGSFVDSRIAFDVALYYMDWQDVQTTLTVLVAPPNTFNSALVNSSSASGFGFDFGTTLRPFDALTLDFTFSMNDLTRDEEVRQGAANTLVGEKGDRLGPPKYTASGSGQYTFPFGSSGYEGSLSTTVNYTSERISRAFANGVLTEQRGDEFLMFGARASIASPSGWTASIFGENLNNTQGTFAFIIPGGQPEQIRLRSLTVGVQFDYQFR
jgi:iron complex outermembrane recepter protein